MNGTSLRHSIGSGGIGEPAPVATLVVYKDDAGYGMKISSDKPVYVLSVKEGGAAARAGLHAGDEIIKVNGLNVTQSTHSEVAELIKASNEVVLTVQQKAVSSMESSVSQSRHHRPTSLTTSAIMVSPSQAVTSLHRSSTAPAGGSTCNTRITGPQPVDNDKKRQLESQRVRTLQLMLDREMGYVDQLRSKLASKSGAIAGNTNSATSTDLANAERRVKTLQEQLRQFSQGANLSAWTSLNKHQRTKSSPEQLGVAMISPAEASRRLIAAESMNDLTSPRFARHSGAESEDLPHRTPPGTPPPPYPLPNLSETSCSTSTDNIMEDVVASSSPRQHCVLDGNKPALPVIQQPIMSMEDDDMSDQEVTQSEDHGPFKSLSRLWTHHAPLAVFINYLLSNSDPSSLLFYLVTDLYKEGNAKEMRKWAYEIHSSFLVPGAPLHLNNVDENIIREIDDVLHKESDKEERLRVIFLKARARAKEELNEQLADFQSKRTAGMGMLFGPSDSQLDESKSDKAREMKIIEKYLLPKVEHYLEDIEKENVDQRQFTTAVSLATVLTKIFQVRPVHLDRVPTFVAKDKTSHIKARLSAVKTRKMPVRGHHFVAHQYFVVTNCNHCHFIIGGVGPQGYQCGTCFLNVHRQCVRIVEESCPGPLLTKERSNDRFRLLMDRIRPERKPPTSHSHFHQNHMHQIERIKRGEEEANVMADVENGDHRGSNSAGGLRSSNERGRLSGFGNNETDPNMEDPASREELSETRLQQNISSKPKTSNINRSESYKERIHHKRQHREKRKTSDPNLSQRNDSDVGAFPGNSAGSSSNSSLSTRSLDSPSTSLEQVNPAAANASNASSSWDSDVDVEPDPPDWSQGVAEEVLSRLGNYEKKRQEVINELFHTERSHVRALKVLSQVFHKPLIESQVLPMEHIQLLFSNLDEMVLLHATFNQAMKRKKKENPCVGDIGELLLSMFDGESSEVFERAASKYCAKQQVALRALRDQRRKDPKLNAFLNEVEANPMCRRLQLKDHILTGMLRLTKYPLLFENLAKYTADSNEKEKTAVLRSLERSKEILSRVNQAVRVAEDSHRLLEIEHSIDFQTSEKVTEEYKNLDLTKRKLIYEGPLQWRVLNRAKPVDLHVVLLDDTILLLHRQDEKYVLKVISPNQGTSDLSPIVKVSTVLVRHNAVDKNSLYLVNTAACGAQIYNLVAPSPAERKLWFKHISECAETCKARDREGRRPPPSSAWPDMLVDLTEEQFGQDADIPLDKPDEGKRNYKENEVAEGPEAPSTTPFTNEEKETEEPEDETREQEDQKEENAEAKVDSAPKKNTEVDESAGSETNVVDLLRIVTCTESSLIDPLEVVVDERPVHIAEPVLTPVECLWRKDEAIKLALMEKQTIVESILNISKSSTDSAAAAPQDPSTSEKEPVAVIFEAIGHANQLMDLLNSALTVTGADAVLASRGAASSAQGGCEALGCQVSRPHPGVQEPSIPVSKLQPICHSLTSNLLQILKLFNEREEERDRLRKELRRSRERLHVIDADLQRRSASGLSPLSPTESQTSPTMETQGKELDTSGCSNDGTCPNVPLEAENLSDPSASGITEEPPNGDENDIKQTSDSVG